MQKTLLIKELFELLVKTIIMLMTQTKAYNKALVRMQTNLRCASFTPHSLIVQTICFPDKAKVKKGFMKSVVVSGLQH